VYSALRFFIQRRMTVATGRLSRKARMHTHEKSNTFVFSAELPVEKALSAHEKSLQKDHL
jgi:hypothetical protein